MRSVIERVSVGPAVYTAWLVQASGGVSSGRFYRFPCQTLMHTLDGYTDHCGKGVSLPGGVIGNTEAFGASIPGSSPGRVDLIRS